MKQEPRTWCVRMDGFLMSLVFTKSKEDPNIYFKFEGEKLVMLLLYVDDMFLMGEDELIKDARRIFVIEFEMK